MTKTASSDPLVGDVLDGRYEIMARLARGGMATVYRAWDRRLERVVAIKVMHEGLGDDDDFAAKFDREARAAARLCDANVVTIYDQGQDHGRPYIVMEFVGGPTLRSIITKQAPLSPAQVLAYIEPVAAALAVAHESGLVHRDVKPENVLIDESGVVKVADFGLARSVQAATATQGLLIGTVSYLPPELLTHGKADAWSDVYSTGVMMFEMLTGTKPHTGDAPITIAYKHVNEDIEAPSVRLAARKPEYARAHPIPDYLDALVLACTRRDEHLRPVDGRALLRLVRKARRAIAGGIANDDALTMQMYPAVALPSAAPTEVLTPDAALAATAITDRPMTVPMPAPIDATTVDEPAYDEEPDEPAHYLADHAPGASTPVAPPPAERYPKLAAHQKARRRRTILAMIAIVLLTLLIGTGSWWLASGRYATTPSVINLTQDEATQTAEANGFAISFTEEFSDTVPQGLVISSDPEAGARVVRNTTITAVISKGPDVVGMPAVVGSKKDDARAAIESAGLTVGEISYEFHDDVPEDHVIGAQYGQGEMIKRGESVALTVSKGRQPVDVLDLKGKHVDEAIAQIEEAGLNYVVKEEREESDDIPADHVFSQDPNSGTVYRGDTITLVISSGPKMVKVPDVIGDSSQAGIGVLQEAGFDVSVQGGGSLFRSVIKSTDPEPGTEAREGATVTVTLGNP